MPPQTRGSAVERGASPALTSAPPLVCVTAEGGAERCAASRAQEPAGTRDRMAASRLSRSRRRTSTRRSSRIETRRGSRRIAPAECHRPLQMVDRARSVTAESGDRREVVLQLRETLTLVLGGVCRSSRLLARPPSSFHQNESPPPSLGQEQLPVQRRLRRAAKDQRLARTGVRRAVDLSRRIPRDRSLAGLPLPWRSRSTSPGVSCSALLLPVLFLGSEVAWTR
jgi:hypothetical protein